MGKEEGQNKVPDGKLARAGIIGAAAAKAGLKKLGHVTKKPFLSPEEEIKSRRRNDGDIAGTVFKALATLKGAPLKLAQMLSMEMELLPDEYRKELVKSASQVPPMNRALIRKVITTELGAAPEKIFREFEPVPFAAASLGQVHRAKAYDGRELAVKVQYPGIAEAVKTDLKLLRGLVSITPCSRLLDGAIREINDRIHEELDYEKEAVNTNWFREHSASGDVCIPEVIPELSTKRVLSTVRIEGLHLDGWLCMDPPKHERDRYGQILCDLFMENTWRHRIIHADPNPGNFIFMKDGRLGVIDFGCVKVLNEGFLGALQKLRHAVESRDVNEVMELYGSIGISYKSSVCDKGFGEFIIGWISWVTEPVRSEFFDFGTSPDFFNEGRKMALRMYGYMDRFDGSMLYFGRAQYGLYRILHRLGAAVRMNFFNRGIGDHGKGEGAEGA